MIGDYGRAPNAMVQVFLAQAIHRVESREITIHTDGVVLTCEESPEERRAGFNPAFRLIAGKQYRVIVEELP